MKSAIIYQNSSTFPLNYFNIWRKLHLISHRPIVAVAYSQLFGMGGGGGQDPQIYRQKKKKPVYVTLMRERAPQKHICRSQNTSAYIINAVPFYYLWCGAIQN